MIRREITGPQAKYERTGAQGFRDVRPTTARLSEVLRGSTSAFVLTGLGGATWFYPALLNVTVPGSLLYATWVLTQRVVLPLRLPRSARRKDWGNPDPANRKPRQAAGTHYVGRDATTGQELWLTNEDARQHASIPGTTGAGKTTAILGQLANSLAMGSGFVLVDGKADNKLFGEVMALARRFGREDDVLALNFLVASGVKESNTFNPFAAGNADAIRELLVSQLGEQQSSDQNGVFRGRAVALIGTIAPVLAWMRDTHGISINIEAIRFSMELRWIGILAVHKVFLVRNRTGGNPDEIPVPNIPDEILYPLQAYLGEIPGYDTSVEWNQQKDSKPSEQHGFALMYFTNTFTQLSVSLGHIFKVQTGDIDMRDVVLNRRILVVNLPALENSDDTLAALGKIVVASLRGMMAQMLGARLEGKPDEIFSLKPGTGDGPFYIVFDELAYYASSGMDRMLAMGRGLNMTFWLAFQESVRHLGTPGREDGEPARQRQPDPGHAPAGCQPDPGVAGEDGGPDLRHPGHHLSGWQRRPVPRGAARRGQAGLPGGLGRSAAPDRGRGDRAVRRPARLRQAVPCAGGHERAGSPEPPRHAGAAVVAAAASRAGRDGGPRSDSGVGGGAVRHGAGGAGPRRPARRLRLKPQGRVGCAGGGAGGLRGGGQGPSGGDRGRTDQAPRRRGCRAACDRSPADAGDDRCQGGRPGHHGCRTSGEPCQRGPHAGAGGDRDGLGVLSPAGPAAELDHPG